MIRTKFSLLKNDKIEKLALIDSNQTIYKRNARLFFEEISALGGICKYNQIILCNLSASFCDITSLH